MNSGIGKIVYGIRKASSSTVELEDGELLHKPKFPFGDCRACCLADVTCEEELETPCLRMCRECSKPEDKRDCEECDNLEECLSEKPCCWDCPYLAECLEMAKDWCVDRFVKDIHGCDWDEFLAAVKMLAGDVKEKEVMKRCEEISYLKIQTTLGSYVVDARRNFT